MKYEILADTTEPVEKFYDTVTGKVGNNCGVDLSRKEICQADLEESVRRAFRDLTVRTMDPRDSNAKFVLDNLAQECCERGLYKLLDAWINQETTDSFDIWHKNACDTVIEFLKIYYSDKDCTYGKAQKIVNMTFKNLYAICVKKGIAATYAERFAKCHIPLDSFTLEWFYRNATSENCKVIKGRIARWSAIKEYGNEETEEYTTKNNKGNNEVYYTYFYFQKIFRQWYPNKTLQAEFVIWPKIQMELAAEGFLFAWLADKEELTNQKKMEYKAASLEEKIKMIRQKLNP